MKTRCPLSPTFLPPGKCPGVLPSGGAKVWKGVGVKETSSIVPVERIEKAIFMIRGHKVMLSSHLADLYGVVPKVLVQAVKRNGDRFPEDFMFQLSAGEFANLKSQFVTSSWGGLRRARPYAFTEQGVAMLSSVLRSMITRLWQSSKPFAGSWPSPTRQRKRLGLWPRKAGAPMG